MLLVVTVLVCAAVGINQVAANEESNKYGSHFSRCEFEALKLGTELSDIYNAPDLSHDWFHRVYQNEIVEKLGFAPWMANGIPGSGNTLTGQNARDLHAKNHWVGSSTDSSPYTILNHKWIYMFGDSTTRQIWASYAAPFKGNNFERNAKEWTRSYCSKQDHRKRHGDHGHFDDEGWRGPCGKNEVTCHISGYGDRGLLSYDWKHFPFEDYDEFMWSDQGPWVAGFSGEGVRRPDLLTIQMGLHSCWHAVPEGLYSQHLNGTNQHMIDTHINDVTKLFSAVRRAIDTQPKDPAAQRNETTVVILTSGVTGLGEAGLKTDACVQKMNRAVSKAAHEHNFVVLDRGEIERRFLHKSLFAQDVTVPLEMHLIQPAQNIIATSLLDIYRCALRFDISRSKKAGDPVITYPLKIDVKPIDGHARPLHMPPPA